MLRPYLIATTKQVPLRVIKVITVSPNYSFSTSSAASLVQQRMCHKHALTTQCSGPAATGINRGSSAAAVRSFRELGRCTKLRPFPVSSAIETQTRAGRFGGEGKDPTKNQKQTQSQGRHSEQFNSDAGAPCSAVNGSPLHLLFKHLPLKGSLCLAMNFNVLLRCSRAQ